MDKALPCFSKISVVIQSASKEKDGYQANVGISPSTEGVFHYGHVWLNHSLKLVKADFSGKRGAVEWNRALNERVGEIGQLIKELAAENSY